MKIALVAIYFLFMASFLAFVYFAYAWVWGNDNGFNFKMMLTCGFSAFLFFHAGDILNDYTPED